LTKIQRRRIRLGFKCEVKVGNGVLRAALFDVPDYWEMLL
jgi:hypothetical protein